MTRLATDVRGTAGLECCWLAWPRVCGQCEGGHLVFLYYCRERTAEVCRLSWSSSVLIVPSGKLKETREGALPAALRPRPHRLGPALERFRPYSSPSAPGGRLPQFLVHSSPRPWQAGPYHR